MFWSVFDRVENIVGECFPQYLQEAFSGIFSVGFKGGPSDPGTKILQRYWKIILILPKNSNFYS